MVRVFIGIGSNIKSEKNIVRALELLSEAEKIRGIATFYRTEPLRMDEGDFFYNGVVEIETRKSPHDLKKLVLKRIEVALGRVRSGDKFSSRPIDLDILVYGDLVIDEPDMKIPDPDIFFRPHIAIPLSELAPDFIHPVTGQAFKDIAGSFGLHDMEELGYFTLGIRRRFT